MPEEVFIPEIKKLEKIGFEKYNFTHVNGDTIGYYLLIANQKFPRINYHTVDNTWNIDTGFDIVSIYIKSYNDIKTLISILTPGQPT